MRNLTPNLPLRRLYLFISPQGISKPSNKSPTNCARTSPPPCLFSSPTSRPWNASARIRSCSRGYLKRLTPGSSAGIQKIKSGRIDACELYCSFLLLSKASYETFLKSIIDIFGFESQGRITRNEFFFFLDSFYRMLAKVLIVKGFDKPSA